MNSILCADAPSLPKKPGRETSITWNFFYFIFFFFEGREHLYTGSMSSSQSEEQMYMKLVQPPPLICIPWGRGGGAFSLLTEKGSHILDCNNCEWMGYWIWQLFFYKMTLALPFSQGCALRKIKGSLVLWVSESTVPSIGFLFKN